MLKSQRLTFQIILIFRRTYFYKPLFCRLLYKSTPFTPSVKNKILIPYTFQITYLRHFDVFFIKC